MRLEPQLSRHSSGGGGLNKGGVQGERALGVAYQTWQDLAALWSVGESIDKLPLSSFLPLSLGLIAFSGRVNDTHSPQILAA